jgi:hypothetical protein
MPHEGPRRSYSEQRRLRFSLDMNVVRFLGAYFPAGMDVYLGFTSAYVYLSPPNVTPGRFTSGELKLCVKVSSFPHSAVPSPWR